ncbi:MAG: PD-(D/E)XK nuclease family transposase, partial [Bacilli bacterium]
QLIADVIVEVENHTINIEMNSSLSSALLYKNAMYIANILASTPIKGQRYNTDKIAVQINFNAKKDILFKTKSIIHKCMVTDIETNEIANKNIIVFHIDLDYLKNLWYHNYSKLTKLEKYLFLIICDETKDYEVCKKNLGDDKIMEKAFETLEQISQDDELVGFYDKEEQDRLIMNTAIEISHKEGKEEVIKNMLKNNLDINLISKYTNLSTDEITKIQNTMI